MSGHDGSLGPTGRFSPKGGIRIQLARWLAIWTVLLVPVGGLTQAYVSTTGSNEYPYDTWEKAAHSIQDAIDATTEGSVFVARGEYVGNIVVPSDFCLWGEGPESCMISGVPPGQGQSQAAVAMGHNSIVSDFCIDGSGCWTAVACESADLRNCAVIGAETGIYGTDSVIRGCRVLGCGYQGIHPYGVSVLYDTVVAGSGTGILLTDHDYVVVLHCTVSGNRRGLANIDGRPIAVRDSVVWGNLDADFSEDLIPPEVVGCVTRDPRFVGQNANIPDDPLFIAWGDFNNSDNPIYVDGSYSGGEAGTKEKPFRTIGAALRAYDFHLALGSPCFRAASDGLNIGAFPYETPGRSPGPPSVRIQVAPGLYREGGVPLVHGEHLKGPGPALATLAPRRHLHAASLGPGSAIEGFFILVDQAGALSAGAATTVANCVITTRAFAPWSPSDWGISSEGARVVNCVIYRMRHAVWGSAHILNSTIAQNTEEALMFDPEAPPTIRNSILWANGTGRLTVPPENVSYSLVSDPNLAGINGNILADPRLVHAEMGHFRLRGDSPCIDAGLNSPELPEFDIAGMHRIMFGGKSLTVDMGAYEFYINTLTPGPEPQATTFTWSSLADKTYSIFYTDDLLNWQIAIANFPSLGNQTTSWLDDGSITGLPPLLAPQRFYRVLENP